MKSVRIYTIACIALAITTINVFGQENKDNRPPKEKWSLVTMQGKVTSIVKETREITLMGPRGDLVTMTASEAVERFDEIAVDDVITFDYYTYMMAEFRKPTSQELADPLVVVAEAGKAPEGMDPGAVVGAVVKAVVTIEVLNRPYMLATIRGPRGNYMTLDVEDGELLTELNIGQQIIFYYAEAVAVSLEKVNTGE
jgi:hypothetical protein